MMYKFLLAGTALLVATAVQASPVTFSSFSPTSSTRYTSYAVKKGVATLSRSAASPATDFNLLYGNLPAEFSGQLQATFALLATSTDAATVSGNSLSQSFSGTLTYTLKTPIDYHGKVYSDLLTVTFVNALLSGQIGSNSVTLDGGSGVKGESVTFSSDIYTFPNSVARDFSVGLTGLSTVITKSGGNFKGFKGTASGNFSADPAPLNQVTVPEAQTWAMLAAGVGLVGFQMRRRTKARATA